MKYYSNKKESSIFVILALATASMMWMGMGIESPKYQQAVAQSPMDMMDMMMGGGNMTDGTMMMGGGNMTDGTMMMGGGNMSMPFNMGVMVMPTMCTTPNQLLGSMTGMMGMMGDEMNGNDGNATQQMMMGMMGQQMMSGGGMENMTELGGMENMTESVMQQAMNLQICFPMMDEKMMQGMMGNGQNNTGDMMNGMMME
jgi:hypothetical protein